MYRSDHIKVLQVLADKLPKRLTLKTKDIVEQAFKRAGDGDRRVRNAYRKLRKEGHIEIIKRGEYRLTNSGAALCRRLKKNNWSAVGEPKKIRKPTKKRARKQKGDASSFVLSF